MTDANLIERIILFIECEGRSCSFDPEAIVVHGSRFMIKGSWTSQATKSITWL